MEMQSRLLSLEVAECAGLTRGPVHMTIALGMLTFFIPSTDMGRVPARLGDAGATVKPCLAAAPPGMLAVAIGALAPGEWGAPAAGTATGACTGAFEVDDMVTWGGLRSAGQELCARDCGRRVAFRSGSFFAVGKHCGKPVTATCCHAGKPRSIAHGCRRPEAERCGWLQTQEVCRGGRGSCQGGEEMVAAAVRRTPPARWHCAAGLPVSPPAASTCALVVSQ